jgi:hypothetical protein
MGTEFFKNAANQYRQYPAVMKIALWLILLSQLPLLYLVCNQLFLGFAIEGCSYHHMHMIDRVLEGKPIYAAASSDHQGVTYTPLYWWVCGGLSKLFGLSMPLARMVSVTASLFFVWIIGAFTWRVTDRNLLLTLFAPCVVLTTNFNTDMLAWFDEINVNPLHLALVAFGFFLLIGKPSTRRSILIAFVMMLAVLAKQTALAYVAAIGAYLLLKDFKQGVIYGVVAAVLIAGSFYILNVASHGDFYKYVVTANQVVPWYSARLWDEVLTKLLVGLFAVLILLTVMPLLLAKTFREFWETAFTPEYLMCAAGIAVNCIAEPKMGSGAIHGVIGIAGLAICGSMGLYRLAKQLSPAVGQKIVAWVTVGQLALLLIPAEQKYFPQLVDETDKARYEQIASIFRSGRTSMTWFPALSIMFGQPPLGYPGDDFCKFVDGKQNYANMPDNIIQPYRDQVFEYVIISPYSDQNDPVVKTILENYKPVGMIERSPNDVRGGNMRYEQYILRAKRLLSPEVAQPAKQGQAGPRAGVNWRPATL